MSAEMWLDFTATLVTVGAVLVAYRALKPAFDSAETAREGIALARAEQEAQREREARQFDVYWGYDRTDPGGPEPYLLMLINRGDQALTDIRIENRIRGSVSQYAIPLLPPGSWRMRYQPGSQPPALGFGYVKPAAAGSFSLNSDPNFAVERYDFRDGEGRTWKWTRGAGLRLEG